MRHDGVEQQQGFTVLVVLDKSVSVAINEKACDIAGLESVGRRNAKDHVMVRTAVVDDLFDLLPGEQTRIHHLDISAIGAKLRISRVARNDNVKRLLDSGNGGQDGLAALVEEGSRYGVLEIGLEFA